MRLSSFAAFLILPVALAACDDPADPCAEFGCDVAGNDLAVTTATMTRASLPLAGDGDVVSPREPLMFSYAILNRGDETSPAAVLWVGTPRRYGNLNIPHPDHGGYVDIPALEPGEVVRGTVVYLAPEEPTYGTDEVVASIRLEWLDMGQSLLYRDDEPSNNGVSITYRLRP